MRERSVVVPTRSGSTGALEDSHPETQVLYISRDAADAIGHHTALATETALLSKPFSRDGLLARVREVLDSDCALP